MAIRDHELRTVGLGSSDGDDVSSEVAELVAAARELRKEFAKTSAEVDAMGSDPTENMRRIHELGLDRIHIPRQYGGFASGHGSFAFAAWADMLVEIGAGEASTSMNWAVNGFVQRELYEPETQIPDSTRRQVAHEVLQDGFRFVASNAELGRPTFDHSVSARRVPGGVLVNGSKHFNTDCGGDLSRTYANVGCILVDDPSRPIHWQALVRLDSEGVERHEDWDNMGQRATMSGGITYRDVFVPDGWHFPQPPRNHSFVAGVWCLHSTILLGPGVGALDAALEYLGKVKRVITPGSESAVKDPLLTRHIGSFSAKLAAARALLRDSAAAIEHFHGPLAEATPVVMQAMRAKIACHEAALHVASNLFELTGARSTVNKYRLDRFWRNARTFASHDPIDLKMQWVGAYEISGEPPAQLQAYLHI